MSDDAPRTGLLRASKPAPMPTEFTRDLDIIGLVMLQSLSSADFPPFMVAVTSVSDTGVIHGYRPKVKPVEIEHQFFEPNWHKVLFAFWQSAPEPTLEAIIVVNGEDVHLECPHCQSHDIRERNTAVDSQQIEELVVGPDGELVAMKVESPTGFEVDWEGAGYFCNGCMKPVSIPDDPDISFSE